MENQIPKETFPVFADFHKVPGTEKALEAFCNLGEGKTDKAFLLCYGEVGCGKTFLCKALVGRLRERGLFTNYYTWSEIIRTFKAHLDRNSIPPFDDVVEGYCRAARLVIDDVGQGLADTNWEMAQLEYLIAQRYEARLLTVLTTNDPTKLPDRVLSRFKDNGLAVIVKNSAPDYRPKKVSKSA